MSRLIPTITQKKKVHEHNLHDNELINTILQYRNIEDPKELDLAIKNLLSFDTMRGTNKAAQLIAEAIANKQRIVVVGDYDCDGATSTATMIKGIKMLGGEDVDARFIIPNREKHGYGLTPAVVKIAGEEEPDLIITVDNGIAAFAGVDEVKKLSKPCKIIVTDHHLMPESGEPVTDATVNPQHPECSFPSKNIAGCGVAFYTIAATRKHMMENAMFTDDNGNECPPPQISALLDYVAIGTIADVVALDYNNRVLVQAGINRIRNGLACPGVRAMIQVINKQPQGIFSSDFGFGIGPRLNAAGRLEDMTIGIKCLLSEDYNEALELAQYLNDLNEKRKSIENDMVGSALEDIETNNLADKMGVCFYNKKWHEGVIGILASRMKDRLARPIIVFTNTHQLSDASQRYRTATTDEAKAEIMKEAGELFIKGSARSVEKVHIKHILDKISKHHPEVLLSSKFGGHHMAAGLSVQYKHFSKFETLFNEYVSKEISIDDINGNVFVDIKDLNPRHITVENADLIKNLLPWGADFEEPLFSGKFTIQSYKAMKNKATGEDRHLRLVISPLGNPDITYTAVWFNCLEPTAKFPVGEQCTIEISYRIDVNEWRGQRNIQIMINSLNNETFMQLEEIKAASINEETTVATLPGISGKK